MAMKPPETPAPDWLLVMGDVQLGALWLSDIDQPWYCCLFEPTPAFETVRPLYAAMDEALRAGDADRDIELIDEMEEKGICLIWGNGQRQPRPDMAGSLQVFGSEAVFRPDRVRFHNGKPVPDE
jgi:hypothetical protein